MTQEQIAALLLRRDRSISATTQLEILIETGTTSDQARIEDAIKLAHAAAHLMEECVSLLTPP
jgi:hypothetical protein